MLGEDKNIKDSNLDSDVSIKDNKTPFSYSKSNKLIAALYIVTDIMDITEPIRNKLRTLSVEIISDINLIQQNHIGHTPSSILGKVREILSFLDISSTINLISMMNYSILKREFIALEQSIKEYGKVRSLWLEEFLIDSAPTIEEKKNFEIISFKNQNQQFKGHEQSSRTYRKSTRIGVQKGSTLMQALSDKKFTSPTSLLSNKDNFNAQKKQRRNDIIQVIKTGGEGLTITDIKAKGLSLKLEALVACGEKTLQRELIGMVKDGVLYKKGEKRWSKYFIKN